MLSQSDQEMSYLNTLLVILVPNWSSTMKCLCKILFLFTRMQRWYLIDYTLSTDIINAKLTLMQGFLTLSIYNF